jgi:single-stranded DNA-binding protein
MTNRITLSGKLVDAPKVRTLEGRSGSIEIVSLWVEAASSDRTDRFTVEIKCPKAAALARAMQAGVIAEVTGQLRHDRWKDKDGKWTGKVFIAVDPGQGQVRSKGMAETADAA